MRIREYMRAGVGYGYGETYSPHDGDIYEIIPHIAHLPTC
jgi:hypothetical protein